MEPRTGGACLPGSPSHLPIRLPCAAIAGGLLAMAGLGLPGLPRAQEGGAGVMACFAELPPDEFAGRFEVYADGVGFDARMADLCARGDEAGATALAAEVEAGFLRADPVAAGVRRCLARLTATTGASPGEVCDASGG